MSAEWRTLLTELGELGDALSAAIESGDALAAIATMMQLRRTRSALGRVELQARGEDVQALLDIPRLLAVARGVEAMMDRWLARPVALDAELLASGIGIATIADKLLPAVWDFDTDLVVLAGEALAPVGELLCDLGQKRIVLVGVDRPFAIRADSPAEVAAAIRSLVPAPPQQLMLRGVTAVDEIAEAARAAVADLRIHRNTIRAFSRTWIEQGAENAPALGRWPSVAALDGAFRGVPMVIAAPGPSLAKNVAQLRELRGRAIVTAFSHSLKAVLAAGVTPDLVLTVDPQDVRYHFAGCDLSQTCLVNAATAHPSLYALPAPRMLSLSANCAIDDWIFDALGEQALVPGGGSVATSAFSLALRWGCDPIVFVGLDLSFSNGNYYVGTSCDGGVRASVDNGVVRVENWSAGFNAMKARGGSETPAFIAEEGRAVALPGWAGGTVPSTFMFGLFHRWFVDRMKSVGETRVYNCTEGGVSIAGMTHVPLAEVASTLDREVTVARAIDRAIAEVDVPERTARLAGRIGAFVQGLRRSGRLAAAARAMIANGETGARLERVEAALTRSLEPLGFASLVAQRQVERAHEAARREGGTAGEYLAASAQLLNTLGEVIDQLEPIFAAAYLRLAVEGQDDAQDLGAGLAGAPTTRATDGGAHVA